MLSKEPSGIRENQMRERLFQYRDLMPLMITDWRNRWGYDFPFYMVQLASFTAKQTAPVESTWAELRKLKLGLYICKIQVWLWQLI